LLHPPDAIAIVPLIVYNFKLKLIFTYFSRIFRWGSTYNLYSFLKVWVTYDGNYVEVVPAPSTKGQHCGICGNYNRQQKDEFSGKSGDNRLDSAADLVKEWQWKC
jgi:hypothetical protein